MAISKKWLDNRVSPNGRNSHINMSNRFELGAYINSYLLDSTSSTMSLANVLGVANATGGTDILMTPGDVITSTAGTNFNLTIQASLAMLNGASSFAFMDPLQSGLNDISDILATDAGIQVADNSPIGGVAAAGTPNRAVFINSGTAGGTETSFNQAVNNSVAVGGDNMLVKTDNTAYVNQISLQPAGNVNDGLLTPPVLTADVTWDLPNASGRVLIQRVVDVAATPHTAVDGETILVDAATAGGNVTVDLPAAANNMRITVKKVDAGVNTVILDPNAAELIEGGATHTLTAQWEVVTIVSNGTSWFIVSN